MSASAESLSDAAVAAWLRARGVPGIVDLHVHFMPDRVQQKVWGFFDRVTEQGEPAWPIRYRGTDEERVAQLRAIGVSRYATLSYAHRPGMAQWLNDYAERFAAAHPEAIPSATFYPEPDAGAIAERALDRGAQVFKIHVQVGDFSPLDPRLTEAWERVAAAGTPVVIHCGDGPHRGRFTGLGPVRALVERHPSLVLVIAHAGLPDYLGFAALAAQHPHVYLDTTMVGTSFMERVAPLPPGYVEVIAGLGPKVVLGTDFPSIPYPYGHQLEVLDAWGLGDAWLADALWNTPRRLLRLDGS
ncbi:MAG: amidohydrolase [Actinobacteria bacterium]|nr:amidohydrolase [Actinomycetota bacterium]